MNWNEFFAYKEGKLFWNIARRKIKLGQEIKSVNSAGYLKVSINGKYYLAHRIIYEMFYGAIPKDLQVDHIDGDRRNNYIANLRLASCKENGANRGKPENNSSGFKGVDWSKYHNKWRVRVNHKHVGYFQDLESASIAYQEAARVKHKEFYKEKQ